ncbi:hypothetical protein [Streptomyces sp. NK15101]|uniref:hypothetical protein n=1 Tax=Streptomyces sp. NK15101 TaxID=2873261 RepID=UPI0035A8B0C3
MSRLVEDTPRHPGPGETQVQVHAVGICGSDRAVYLGRPAASGPEGRPAASNRSWR